MNNPTPPPQSGVPEFLDGARVLFTAPAIPGQIGHDRATGESVAISYFAIATYPEHQPRVYLFGVSATHEVVCDFDCESPEDAMQTSADSKFTQHEFHASLGK